MNTTLRCLKYSTCCSILPPNCHLHCLRFLERYDTSVFLVLLIFISACLYAAKNWSNACWKPRWEDARSTKFSKANGWSQCRSSPTLPPPKMLTGVSLIVIHKKSFQRYATSRGRMVFQTKYPNCGHNFGRIWPVARFSDLGSKIHF